VDIDERREQLKQPDWSPAPASAASASAAPTGKPAAAKTEQRKTKEPKTEEPEVPLAAVCVYDVVIEAPAPAEESYAGPERRTRTAGYEGLDRRQSA
jgi:hypothetical protein